MPLALQLVESDKGWTFLEEYNFFTREYLPTRTRKFSIFLLFVGALNFVMAHETNLFGAKIFSPRFWGFLPEVLIVVLGIYCTLLASGNTIFSIKEEYWPMIPMFTYGLNEWVGDKKIRNIYWVWIIFMYPKTVHNHYHNRGAL